MTDEERAERMVGAMLASLDVWIAQVEEISVNAIPVTGNLGRALHLLKSLEQARITLRKLAGLPEQ